MVATLRKIVGLMTGNSVFLTCFDKHSLKILGLEELSRLGDLANRLLVGFRKKVSILHNVS